MLNTVCINLINPIKYIYTMGITAIRRIKYQNVIRLQHAIEIRKKYHLTAQLNSYTNVQNLNIVLQHWLPNVPHNILYSCSVSHVIFFSHIKSLSFTLVTSKTFCFYTISLKFIVTNCIISQQLANIKVDIYVILSNLAQKTIINVLK